MGYIRTISGALVCDGCGSSVGVRKRRCPHGWCAAPALCADCRKRHTVNHDECKVKSDAFDAHKAKGEAIMEAGGELRCSAVGIGIGLVEVSFRSRGGVITSYSMSKEVYDSISLGSNATPDHYRAFGEVTQINYGPRA